MAGIYTRDNLASLYASNLEKALARRDAYEKERQERVSKMYGDGTPKTGDGPEKKKKPPKIGGVKD
jgi:hypothetical protein